MDPIVWFALACALFVAGYLQIASILSKKEEKRLQDLADEQDRRWKAQEAYRHELRAKGIIGSASVSQFNARNAAKASREASLKSKRADHDHSPSITPINQSGDAYLASILATSESPIRSDPEPMRGGGGTYDGGGASSDYSSSSGCSSGSSSSSDSGSSSSSDSGSSSCSSSD